MMTQELNNFLLCSKVTGLLPITIFFFFCFFITNECYDTEEGTSVASKKTSSSSGTYLCLMQENACGRWTLGVMFPPGYRVSNCEGYKQGSTWLRMQTA
jgi:hypothetical protein